MVTRMTERTERIVYLMRGLPCCGKSHTAVRLAGETGVVCETDQYFYSEVGDDPHHYNFDTALLPAARDWVLASFQAALQTGRSPIVVDRGNGRNAESRVFVELADRHGYSIEIREPDSPWWQELRVLLKYREFVADELFDQWAEALAEKSVTNHRVPVAIIRKWMRGWKHDLTVNDIRTATTGTNDRPKRYPACTNAADNRQRQPSDSSGYRPGHSGWLD